jgi:hypothetical protein
VSLRYAAHGPSAERKGLFFRYPSTYPFGAPLRASGRAGLTCDLASGAGFVMVQNIWRLTRSFVVEERRGLSPIRMSYWRHE